LLKFNDIELLLGPN